MTVPSYEMVDSKWYTAVSKLIELLKSSTSGEEDRTLAAKELAGLAASDSTNERMNRQNMIVDTGAGIPLVRQMVEGKSEEERWWAALALVQLTFGNERTIERLIDASVLGDTSKIVKRWMIGDEAVENEVIDQEDRECVVRAATKILSNEVAYSTDRSTSPVLFLHCPVLASENEASQNKACLTPAEERPFVQVRNHGTRCHCFSSPAKL